MWPVTTSVTVVSEACYAKASYEASTRQGNDSPAGIQPLINPDTVFLRRDRQASVAGLAREML
jgi:hypothetical protein